MEQKRGQRAKGKEVFDVAAAVAEHIRELEAGREELMRKDAEINRLIDEAREEIDAKIPFSPKSPRSRK